jgi:hypothetical protein
MSLSPDCSDSWSDTAEWVSWRDECDATPDVVIAIATGEQALCDHSMLAATTEYLPVPADIGMTEKRALWA